MDRSSGGEGYSRHLTRPKRAKKRMLPKLRARRQLSKLHPSPPPNKPKSTAATAGSAALPSAARITIEEPPPSPFPPSNVPFLSSSTWIRLEEELQIVILSVLLLIWATAAMVSVADSQLPSPQSPCASSARLQRRQGRSMRTFRSKLFQAEQRSCFDVTNGAAPRSPAVSENLTDSVVDFRLRELAGEMAPAKSGAGVTADLLEFSQDFSDVSSFNSDISGELQRLASVGAGIPNPHGGADPAAGADLALSSLTSGEIYEIVTLDNLEAAVRSCVEVLDSSSSSSVESKRGAAGKLRLLAKHRSDFRAVIGACPGAIASLVPLLRSTDPATQENVVTALLNLSLEEANKAAITAAGAIKPLVYALRTGTAAAKQNAACALLNLSMIEDNRATVGACGAIPPLVSLLLQGSSRGKKDALTTLYKLCTTRRNKERAVSAGAVRPLVELVVEHGAGTTEKAMVVLSSLAGVAVGREAVVEEGGIPALVEAIEDGSVKGKEFAVATLLQLCADSPRNRALLVREGAIPPLVALSQSGSARAKHKAETLLAYLREQRHEASPAAP